MFRRVKPEELAKNLYEWLAEAREGAFTAVNIDGKTIQGSGNAERGALHVVSARAGEEELILGQVAVDEKSNEIRAIPKLLELLDVKGAMMAIDAMGCQKGTTVKIREQKADYLLAVKYNQPALRQNVREYFEGLESGEIRELPEDVWTSEEETGHGRTEKREARTAAGVDWMAGKKDRPDLETIIKYRCRRTVNGKQTVSGRYYISNTNKDAG